MVYNTTYQIRSIKKGHTWAMARLEQLTRGAVVKGILPDALITVVDVQWHGDVAITLTYRDAAGRLGNEILYRDREPSLEIAIVDLPWSFDGDGALLRLVSEAYRIHLAYLFDPLLSTFKQLSRDRNWLSSDAVQGTSLNLYLIVLTTYPKTGRNMIK